MQQGSGDRWHAPAGGPLIHLQSIQGGLGHEDALTISNRLWRLCGLSNHRPAERVLAPVSRRGGKSEVMRHYSFENPSSMSVWYARRNRSADGATCANPYVSYIFNGRVHGDRFAGRVSISFDGRPGEPAAHVAHWQARPGYRICYAAGRGIVGVPGARYGWVDRRHGGSLSHVLDRYDNCCPNHPGEISYFFAAFRRE